MYTPPEMLSKAMELIYDINTLSVILCDEIEENLEPHTPTSVLARTLRDKLENTVDILSRYKEQMNKSIQD